MPLRAVGALVHDIVPALHADLLLAGLMLGDPFMHVSSGLVVSGTNELDLLVGGWHLHAGGQLLLLVASCVVQVDHAELVLAAALWWGI